MTKKFLTLAYFERQKNNVISSRLRSQKRVLQEKCNSGTEFISNIVISSLSSVSFFETCSDFDSIQSAFQLRLLISGGFFSLLDKRQSSFYKDITSTFHYLQLKIVYFQIFITLSFSWCVNEANKDALRLSMLKLICTGTGYGPNDRGVGVPVPVWSRIFTLYVPDRL
jgi:hypothetical protein